MDAEKNKDVIEALIHIILLLTSSPDEVTLVVKINK